jgi:hypothetical protein
LDIFSLLGSPLGLVLFGVVVVVVTEGGNCSWSNSGERSEDPTSSKNSGLFKLESLFDKKVKIRGADRAHQRQNISRSFLN